MPRPTLNNSLNAEDFKQFYWLKSELIVFCQANKLKSSGSKEQLNQRIAYFLKTGQALKESGKELSQEYSVDYTKLSLQSKIGPNYKTTREIRNYFESLYGKSFKISVALQDYCRQNPDKTFADALLYAKEYKKTKTEIAPQFEYNTYIRDFMANNKDKSLAQAIKCWKYKKSLKGSNQYEARDLKALF